MKHSRRIRTLAFVLALALGLGVWTLAAVDFVPVTSQFQQGDTVSAEAFNELFDAIDQNFASAEVAINSKVDADQVSSISWSLTGNSGLVGDSPPFLGTTDDSPLQLRVNNLDALTIIPEVHPEYGYSPIILGGLSLRTAGIAGATVSGGGSSDNHNVVQAHFATIGGGRGNQAGGLDESAFPPSATGDYTSIAGGLNNKATGDYATISGGEENAASGVHATIGGGSENEASELWTTVGGGNFNRASGRFGTIGGGVSNSVEGFHDTVGGGIGNIASGTAATVPGGLGNRASGSASFAAGRNADAQHDGSFVWADASAAAGETLASSAAHQFNVRASGGTRIFSDTAATVGVQLAPGGNDWSALSDRNLKANVRAADAQEILEKLNALSISEWNLTSQDPSIRHMGPMAQDFYAVFGLGESETHISATNTSGVAFAAIQGLHQLVQDQDARIAVLEQQNAELRALMLEFSAALGHLPADNDTFVMDMRR